MEWQGGNQEKVWVFSLIYIIHLPILKIFHKFPKICEAEKQLKDKEKLNRIIENQPITHVTLFLFEIQYFIFEEGTLFLPFITSDHNNNCLRW